MLDWLYSRTRTTERGYKNTRILLDHLGSPDTQFRNIRVLGTNGKGSTCAMLEAGLLAAGTRVGCFTGPHLERYEERIRINGQELARSKTEQFIAWAQENTSQAAFFELTLALAAQVFAEAEVEYAVIEAGVGGRLDATQALNNTVAVCLTNVGLDHMPALGTSLEEIAADKAGAAQKGIPFLTTADCDVLPIIRAIADEQESPLYTPKTHPELFAVSDQPALSGVHQQNNASLAIATLRLLGYDDALVYQAALSARHPGRLETFVLDGKTIILDGAHNAHAAQALARCFSDGVDVLLFGGLSRKDTQATLQPLLELATNCVFTAPNEKATDPHELARLYGGSAITDPKAALQQARHLLPCGGTLLVTGSLYLIGEIRKIICAELP